MSLTLLLNSQKESFTAKAVIFDIANSHGGAEMGVRQIDFYYQGSKFNFDSQVDGNGAAATSFYSYDFFPVPVFETNMTVSKTGTASGTSWLSKDTNTPQRLIVVSPDSAFTFDEIVVNNYHDSGGDTNKGAKNVIITTTDNTADITVGYNDPIPGTTEVIFNGQFNEHVASDVEDEQSLSITSAAIANSFFAFMPSMILYSICGAQSEVLLPSFSMEVNSGAYIKATIPDITIQAFGTVSWETDDFEVELPSFEIDIRSGGSTQIETPTFQMEAEGDTSTIFDVEIELPPLKMGMVSGGEISASLSRLDIVNTETSTQVPAFFNADIPSLRISGGISRASEGFVEASLPGLNGVVDAKIGIVGSILSTLYHPTFTGIVLTGIVGEVETSFNSICSIGAGGSMGPGIIETALPALRLSINSGIIESDVLRYEKGKVR